VRPMRTVVLVFVALVACGTDTPVVIHTGATPFAFTDTSLVFRDDHALFEQDVVSGDTRMIIDAGAESMRTAAAAYGWLGWFHENQSVATLGRRSPDGRIEEVTLPATILVHHVAAAPDGVVFTGIDVTALQQPLYWVWTDSAPVQMDWPRVVEPNRIAADAAYIYFIDYYGEGRRITRFRRGETTTEIANRVAGSFHGDGGISETEFVIRDGDVFYLDEVLDASSNLVLSARSYDLASHADVDLGHLDWTAPREPFVVGDGVVFVNQSRLHDGTAEVVIPFDTIECMGIVGPYLVYCDDLGSTYRTSL
jgi:hypothetical protein